MKEIRSYTEEVMARVEQLKTRPYIKVQKIGGLWGDIHLWPFYLVVADNGDKNQKDDILISGGVHGNEPAGVWTSLKFLEEVAPAYLDKFRFFVFPCVNPSGYVYNTHTSIDGFNINRQFKSSTISQENHFIMNSLSRGTRRYTITFDLHETDYNFENEELRSAGFTKDDNPREFWLYELTKNHTQRIGRKIIEAMRSINVPVCTQSSIFGDVNSDGVVWYPEGYKSDIYAPMTTFEGFLIQNYTNHALTTETISNWDSDIRMKAQLLVVTTALNAHKNN